MICFNGKIVNENDFKLSYNNRYFIYGDGFFETMLWQRFQNQKKNFGVEFWDKHLKRIKKGCDLMKINIPSETEFLKQRKERLTNQ